MPAMSRMRTAAKSAPTDAALTNDMTFALGIDGGAPVLVLPTALVTDDNVIPPLGISGIVAPATSLRADAPGLSDDEAGVIPSNCSVAYQRKGNVQAKEAKTEQTAEATNSQLHDADVRLLDETGTLSAVSDDVSRQRRANKSHQRRPDQKSRKAGSTRRKPTNQKAEHVQLTIDIRLDPRLLPSGVRSAESGSGSEDGTRED